MSEIESIIQKYLQGNTSEEENHQLHQWTEESPENKRRLFTEKDIWDTYGFHSNQKKYEPIPELEILKKRIEPKKSQRSVTFQKIMQMAAVLLIAFGLGWSSRFISFTGKMETAEVSMQEVFVPKGQVNQVFLADGTRIWVNSETRLSIPSVFARNERVVRLNGEAFFEVAKDKKRPFRVEVNGQQIEVLGTSFNVRAYESSNKIETTLETGQIQLRTGNQTNLIKPGEQSLYDKTNKRLIISKVDPGTFSSWKDGRYEFQNEDLIEVFKVIERWCDVEIIADEAYFSGMHFSGVIKRNKDAKHFLELLNHTIPIRYEINSDKIHIMPK
ncbi:MAG: FecR domain-containing protein [Bacteroidota bacterium]|nr:FecR domain-containing protein [Bacteroidota bacterium]